MCGAWNLRRLMLMLADWVLVSLLSANLWNAPLSPFQELLNSRFLS